MSSNQCIASHRDYEYDIQGRPFRYMMVEIDTNFAATRQKDETILKDKTGDVTRANAVDAHSNMFSEKKNVIIIPCL